jgi:anti-anti-sigma factor
MCADGAPCVTKITVTIRPDERLKLRKENVGRDLRTMETYRPFLTAIMDDSGDVDVLKISGDLAWDTMGLLKNSAEVLAGRNGIPLAVDLSDLEFIDSRGMSFLLWLKSAFLDKAFTLVALPENIEKTLERTFILDQFLVCKTIDEVEGIASLTQEAA